MEKELKHIYEVLSEVTLDLGIKVANREGVCFTKSEIKGYLKSLEDIKKEVSELRKINNYNSASDLEKRLKEVEPSKPSKINFKRLDDCISEDIEQRLEAVHVPKICGVPSDAIKALKEESAPCKEMVNHPSHYKGNKYECIDVMQEIFGKEKVSAFCELNAFKYQWRANSKGTDIQDKEKAIWYNKKYIELNKENSNAE